MSTLKNAFRAYLRIQRILFLSWIFVVCGFAFWIIVKSLLILPVFK